MSGENTEGVQRLRADLDAGAAVSVVNEPGIYDEHSSCSFIRDLIVAQTGLPLRSVTPEQAQERLQRHSAYEEQHAADRHVGYAIEHRALGLTAANEQSRALSSTGGEFTPPVWLLDQWVSVARAASPLRRLVRRAPMPATGTEFSLPRFTAVSGVVGSEQAENTNPQETLSGSDLITMPVVTLLGEVPVSQQLYERSDIDRYVLADMADSYAASLEEQLTSGSGSQGQLLGLLNVPTTATDGVPPAILQTWTESTPTPGGLVQSMGQLAAGVANGRLRPPQFYLMRPSRFFWLASVADSNGQPVLRPGTGYLGTSAPDDGPFGPVAGLPVYLDGTLPADEGASGDQDVILAARGSDLVLLEDEPHFTAVIGGAAGGSQMTVFLTFHTYACFFPSRYPSAVGTLTGTGLTVPAGW